MKSKHSSGPWSVRLGSIDRRPVIDDAADYPIATLHSNGDPEGMDRTRSGRRDADAALIAEAPVMYDLLRAVKDAFHDDPCPRGQEWALEQILDLLERLAPPA